MKSFFEEKNYQELLTRIKNVDAKTKSQWGKMNVPQMMHHCQKALEIPLEKATIRKPNLLMKMLFSTFKPSLYNDKPWKQSLPTAKEFVVRDEKEFEKEKKHLLELMEEFHNKGAKGTFPVHPAFGKFTNEQWGQAQYKHIDHHLRQFGA